MQKLVRNTHGFSGEKLLETSRTAFSAGLFLVLWLLCTAFILAPAQAKVNSTVIHPAHQASLPAAWSRWSVVPPGDGATPNAPAASVFENRVYLFVRGTDSKVYFKTFRNGTWSRWSVVPPGAIPLK